MDRLRAAHLRFSFLGRRNLTPMVPKRSTQVSRRDESLAVMFGSRSRCRSADGMVGKGKNSKFSFLRCASILEAFVVNTHAACPASPGRSFGRVSVRCDFASKQHIIRFGSSDNHLLTPAGWKPRLENQTADLGGWSTLMFDNTRVTLGSPSTSRSPWFLKAVVCCSPTGWQRGHLAGCRIDDVEALVWSVPK